MMREKILELQCDRCGERGALREREHRQVRWASVSAVYLAKPLPPNMSIQPQAVFDAGDLCPDCVTTLMKWLKRDEP